MLEVFAPPSDAIGTFYMVFLKFLAAFLIYVRDPGE
jgi:hypothetical protein